MTTLGSKPNSAGLRSGKSGFRVLLDTVNRFEEAKLSYRMNCVREEAVMIEVAVPGERWEVEVFEDGHIEFERFRSDGHIGNSDELDAEFAKHA